MTDLKTTPITCILHANSRVTNFGDCILVHRTEEFAIAKGTNYVWLIDPVEPSPDIHRNHVNLFLKLKYFLSADKFLFSGGGYFTAPKVPSLRWQTRNIFLYVIPILVLRMFRPKIKVGVIAVGFGRLPLLYRRLLCLAIPKEAEIIVRDQESLPHARKFSSNVILGADLALASVPTSQLGLNRVQSSKRILCHISKTRYAGVDIINPLIKFLKNLDDVDLVFVTDTLSNREIEQDKIIRLFRKEFPNANFSPYKNVDSLQTIISDSDLIITTKLHVAIVSFMFGKKILSVPCHPKIVRFFRDIKLEMQAFNFSEDLYLWLCEKYSNAKSGELTPELLARVNLTRKRIFDFL